MQKKRGARLLFPVLFWLNFKQKSSIYKDCAFLCIRPTIRKGTSIIFSHIRHSYLISTSRGRKKTSLYTSICWYMAHKILTIIRTRKFFLLYKSLYWKTKEIQIRLANMKNVIHVLSFFSFCFFLLLFFFLVYLCIFLCDIFV